MIQLGRKYVLASKYGFSFAIRASLIGGSGRQWDVYLRKQLNHKYKICWRRSWVRFTWKDQRPSATAQKADDQTWSEMLMFCVTVGHHETRELTQFMFCSKINVQLCNALFTWISLLLGMLWLVGPSNRSSSPEVNSSSLCLADTSGGEWGDSLQLLYHSIRDIFQFF